MKRSRLLALTVVLGLCAATAAAGDPPATPGGAKPQGKADPEASEPAYKGPEVRWAPSFNDAVEEAAQRNLLVYVHSHGST